MISLKLSHFWLVLLVLSLCERTLQKSFEQQESNLLPLSVDHVNFLVKHEGAISDDDGLEEILENQDSKNTEDIEVASMDSHYRVARQATGSWQPTPMQGGPNSAGQHLNSAQYPATHQLSYPSSDIHQPDFTKQFPMNNPGYSLYTNNNQYGQSLPHFNGNIQPGQTPQYSNNGQLMGNLANPSQSLSGQTPQYPGAYPNHGYNQYYNNTQPGQSTQYPQGHAIAGHSQYPIYYNGTSQPQHLPNGYPNYHQYSNNTQHGATSGVPKYPNVYPNPSYHQYSNNTHPGHTPQYPANGYHQNSNYNLTGQTSHYNNGYSNPNYQQSNNTAHYPVPLVNPQYHHQGHAPVPIPHNRPMPRYHFNMTGPSPHSYPYPSQQSHHPNNYTHGYPQNHRFNQTSNGYPVLNPSYTNPGYTAQYPSAPQYPTNTKTGQTPQYYNTQFQGHQYPNNNQLGQSTQYPGYQTPHY